VFAVASNFATTTFGTFANAFATRSYLRGSGQLAALPHLRRDSAGLSPPRRRLRRGYPRVAEMQFAEVFFCITIIIILFLFLWLLLQLIELLLLLPFLLLVL
jgi:hypothetical protein